MACTYKKQFNNYICPSRLHSPPYPNIDKSYYKDKTHTKLAMWKTSIYGNKSKVNFVCKMESGERQSIFELGNHKIINKRVVVGTLYVTLNQFYEPTSFSSFVLLWITYTNYPTVRSTGARYQT